MEEYNIIQARQQQKHDAEANWIKINDFIPIQGEIIIYDIDENNKYERMKIGDGVTLLRDLPFITELETHLILDKTLTQENQAAEAKVVGDKIKDITNNYLTKQEYSENLEEINENIANNFVDKQNYEEDIKNIQERFDNLIDDTLMGKGYAADAYIVGKNFHNLQEKINKISITHLDGFNTPIILNELSSGLYTIEGQVIPHYEYDGEKLWYTNAILSVINSIPNYSGGQFNVLNIDTQTVDKIVISKNDDKFQVNIQYSSDKNNISIAKAFEIINLTPYDYDYPGSYTLIVLDSVEGIEINDVVSFQTQNGTYYDCGIVTSMNEANSYITTSKLPNTDITNPNGQDTIHGNFLWITSKPNIGTTTIMSQYTYTEGSETEAHFYTAHAEGYKSKAYGKYSHAEGRDTKAYFTAHAEGQNTKALGHASHSQGLSTLASGQYADASGYNTVAEGMASVAAGRDSIALANYSMAMGYGVKTNNLYQFAVGGFNEPQENALFMVGKGGNDNSRLNAFTVFRDGHATLYKQGLTEDSITTKKYVDNKFITPMFGINNKSEGYTSLVMGQNNEAKHTGVLMAGTGNISTRNWQTFIGSYNYRIENDNALFRVGNGGSANTDRQSTAFVVYPQWDKSIEKSGYAEVQYQGETAESIVQKQYVDTLIEELKSRIEILENK